MPTGPDDRQWRVPDTALRLLLVSRELASPGLSEVESQRTDRHSGQSPIVLVPYKELLPFPFCPPPKKIWRPLCRLLSYFHTLGTSCSRLVVSTEAGSPWAIFPGKHGCHITGVWSLMGIPTRFFTVTPMPPCPRFPPRLNQPGT